MGGSSGDAVGGAAPPAPPAAPAAATTAAASLPLSVAFDEALDLWTASQQQASSSAAASAPRLLELLSHAQALVDRAGLFSRNEEQDDLTTASMRYLLLPAMRGDVLNSLPAPSAAVRARHAAAARAAYRSFLGRARQYGLLGPACQGAAVDDDDDDDDSDDDEELQQQQGRQRAAAARLPPPPADPGAARQARIARFKRSRELAGLLQQMRSRQQDGRRRGQDEDAGTEGGPPGGVGGWDEDDERLLWRLQLEDAAIRALDALPVLQQELALLRRASGAGGASERAASSSSSRPQQQQQQMQTQMMHRLSDIAGQLSLGGDRQALRQQVFRPSHILPTLTVEQQGEIELREAMERDAATKAAQAAQAAAAADARSDDEDEAALAKQRAWDDWADDNPRGWGNSKLRPCA